jgi:hypothetical protein
MHNHFLWGGVVEYLGDILTTIMMKNTVMQDKEIIENIHLPDMDGKFNMKYDKIQNVYRSLYTKWIRNVTFSSSGQ